ncbi:hypothetical protein HDV02_005257 [Globomyces sp. JEL0801]|nr:hypothetical protein HDV02_005257 [Globomyces sp. JEL0801]
MSRNSVVGSIPWVAPEAARGHVFTAKVDVWSCGCLVLEMLTGKLPWSQVGGASLFHIGNGNAPPIPPTLSDIAASFLEGAFELDPNKRPTASEARQHPFAAIDRTKIDFRKWAEEATTRYRALNPLETDFNNSNSTPGVSSPYSSLDSLMYDKGTSSNASSVPSVNMSTNELNSNSLGSTHSTTNDISYNLSKVAHTPSNHRLKNITKDYGSLSGLAEELGPDVDIDEYGTNEGSHEEIKVIIEVQHVKFDEQDFRDLSEMS